MNKLITVIGAANVDIIATPLQAYRPCESNPSRVSIGFGGVGRNIAHNLRLLGQDVHFISAFGSDAIAQTLLGDCRRLGMTVDPVVKIDHARSNYFICINDENGEMQAGAADMELMNGLTPAMLAAEGGRLNACRAVVADCNVSEDVLVHLARHCSAPLYVDATSMAKAMRLQPVLRVERTAPLIVKANLAEACALARHDGSAEEIARSLASEGIDRLYVTMGAQGVYCHNGIDGIAMPARPVKVVNATGTGDAFMAAVVHAELHGMAMAEAAGLGMRAAAVALQCPTAVSKGIGALRLHPK